MREKYIKWPLRFLSNLKFCGEALNKISLIQYGEKLNIIVLEVKSESDWWMVNLTFSSFCRSSTAGFWKDSFVFMSNTKWHKTVYLVKDGKITLLFSKILVGNHPLLLTLFLLTEQPSCYYSLISHMFFEWSEIILVAPLILM